MPDNFEKQLRALSDSLQAPLRPTDVENVLPLIVPRSYFQRGNWPGPYVLLRHPRLGLTWVIWKKTKPCSMSIMSARKSLWQKCTVGLRHRCYTSYWRKSIWKFREPPNTLLQLTVERQSLLATPSRLSTSSAAERWC